MLGIGQTIKNRLGYVDFGAPATNGNGKATAGPSDVKAGTTTVGFFSPDNLRTIYQLGSLASSDTDSVTRQTAYAAAIYAYAAMTWRAEKYSEPPVFVGELSDDDEVEWLPDHDLAGLLDHPHPDLDMGELLFQTRLYRDATGSALWVKDLDRAGRIGRLTPFSGDEFTVKRANGRMFGAFEIRTAGGVETLPAERCVYFREPGPSAWGRGVAPLDVALQTLNMGKQATATVKSILKNALFPSVVIQADKEWSPDEDEFKRWKAALDAYAATDQKGKPLGLTGGGKATVVSLSLKDLIPSEILNRVESNIAATFRVPAIVLQFQVGMENSPWSQMEEARRGVTQDTLVPMWRRDGKKLTAQLLRAPTDRDRQPLDDDPMRYIEFSLQKVAALQPDRARQTEQARNSTKFARVQDLRAMVGLEPLDDADPRNDVIPDLTPTAPQPVDGPAEEGEKTADVRGERGGAAWELKAEEEGRRNITWYDFDLFVKAESPGWLSPILNSLNGQREEVEKLAEEMLTEAEGAIDPRDAAKFLAAADKYLDEDGMAALSATMAPLVGSTARRAVERVAAKVGLSFDVLEPGLLTYTEAEAAWLVRGVTNTTKEAIRSALSQSLESGESIGKMAARMKDIGFDRDRARLIARTETTRVTNGAQRKSLQDWSATTGKSVRKSWLSSRDGRVRDEHADLDGETIPVDGVFANGLKEPAEPNCRCTLTYAVVED